MPVPDDDPKLHMHTCTTYDSVRKISAMVAFVSAAAALAVIVTSIWGNDRRRRYPGRLVTCFGAAIFLFDLNVALGWTVDFRQLDWGNGSNYHIFYPHDDNGDRQWYDLCTAQGAVTQFSLMCMACYACWVGIAFFKVVSTRLSLVRLIMSYEEQNHAIGEVLTHVAILLVSAGTAAAAAVNRDVGANSGIVACWVEGYEYQQLYYYYFFMATILGSGVVFSLVATARLWNVLSSAGPADMWEVEHRPLRRIIYGNLVWSVSVGFTGVVPLVDLLTLSHLRASCQTCRAARAVFSSSLPTMSCLPTWSAASRATGKGASPL